MREPYPNFSMSSRALISAGSVMVTGITAPGNRGLRCNGTVNTCKHARCLMYVIC